MLTACLLACISMMLSPPAYITPRLIYHLSILLLVYLFFLSFFHARDANPAFFKMLVVCIYILHAFMWGKGTRKVSDTAIRDNLFDLILDSLLLLYRTNSTKPIRNSVFSFL